MSMSNASRSTSASMDDPMRILNASIAALKNHRDALEAEGTAILSELTTSPGTTTDRDGNETFIPPAGIDKPLVDREGYPRNDIDVYRVRSLRGRLATIRLDRQQIQQQLEQQLHQLMAMSRSNAATTMSPSEQSEERKEIAARQALKPKPKRDPVSGKWVVANWDGTIAGIPGGDKRNFDSVDQQVSTEEVGNSHTDNAKTLPVADEVASETPVMEASSQPKRIPFARVSSVDDGSPASHAGLQPNDFIVQFGDLKVTEIMTLEGSSTGSELSSTVFGKIGPLVPTAAAASRAIQVHVLRQPPRFPGSADSNASCRSSSSFSNHLHFPSGGETVASEPSVLTLQLHPRPWSGRGLLGCHLLPCKPDDLMNER